MGNIAPKLFRPEDSEDVKDLMRERSLETFKKGVLNPALDDEQRKTLLSGTEHGWTFLHKAAFYSYVEIITWLLSDEGRAAGFDSVLAKGVHGVSALHLAAQYGSLECCQAIVNGCRENERQEMLNAIDNGGGTVLHYAARLGGAEIITWLLTEGIAAGFDRKNITALTENHCSCLHLAAGVDVVTVQALLPHCSNEERMNLFLFVNERGWRALHDAARTRDAIVSELLRYPECSLIANRKDRAGMTVLHRAIIGGIDAESQKEWGFALDPAITAALLGSDKTGFTAIDPNIGLGR